MKINLTHLILLVVAAPAFAETTHQLTASVPFRFTVGSKTFEPGDYRVDALAGTHATIVRSTDFKTSAIVQTNSVTSAAPQTQGRLVFRCGEGRCVLSEIWEPGTASGRSIVQSKRDRELTTRVGIPARVRVSVALR